MIQITAQTRILVAIEPADFRRGIDSLARLCRDVLHNDPFSGALFVFRNRNGKSIKILGYDLGEVPHYVEFPRVVGPFT